MILLTGNEEQKETKEIKLEQLADMAVETFVLLLVRTIGGLNMEQEQLITLVE
jgi:hypothetical protein